MLPPTSAYQCGFRRCMDKVPLRDGRLLNENAIFLNKTIMCLNEKKNDSEEINRSTGHYTVATLGGAGREGETFFHAHIYIYIYI